MRSRLVSAVTLTLLVLLAAPAWAGTLQIFEDSLGDPGVIATFAPGSGLAADVDLDASTAEGGSLYQGATDIRIVPIGDAVLVAFACQLASGCGSGTEEDPFSFTFVAGGAGTGYVLIHDGDLSPQYTQLELGDITWDSAFNGGLHLESCAYFSPYPSPGPERSCSPYTIAQTPEPGTAALLGFALAALGLARRRR